MTQVVVGRVGDKTFPEVVWFLLELVWNKDNGEYDFPYACVEDK